MQNNCELNIPYPPAETEGENLRYAALLSNDYAGTVSELTAVTQYFYQHLIIKDKYEKLANSLECISIVEMRHLELLGELIVGFGGDPVIRKKSSSMPLFWSAKYLSYKKNPAEFLKGNIEAEHMAIKAYTERIKQINDEKVRKVLGRIILDEEYHIKIFNSYLNGLE